MMRFRAVASDFDGTLTSNQHVSELTLRALLQVRKSGRKLILITGRILEDLQTVFPELDLFDLVVAENGALVYWPSSGTIQVLGERPPDQFLQRLRRAGVKPLAVGRSIVATVRPHDREVCEAIREFRLKQQVIFNREAVMILPTGVHKGTGLEFALAELGIDKASVIGIGDAENDWDFLSQCGFSVAVANAIPTLKIQVHLVTAGSDGSGVTEVLQKLMQSENLL